MTNPTLERAASLINEAKFLLKKDYRSLAAALEIVYAEIDKQIDLEDERTAHEN